MARNRFSQADVTDSRKPIAPKIAVMIRSAMIVSITALVYLVACHAFAEGNPKAGKTTAKFSDPASSQPSRKEAPKAPADATGTAAKPLVVPDVVAAVDAQRITRDELARECLRLYGKEVLDGMVNRQLITQECKRRNITITEKEVDAEIDRMARQFNIPVDKWLEMLQQERNIKPSQYAKDTIWPLLALRKLAGDKLRITKDEKLKEFEMNCGEQVRARMIAVSSLETAKKLRAQAAADPDSFGNLAKEFSEDATSASAMGMIPPMRKHVSPKEIEDVVFNLADGAVSQVIPAAGQYVIFKREGLISAQPVKFEEVEPQLEEFVRERKMKPVSQEIFKQLQSAAKVEDVWNDPAKRAKMPDTAAIVNGSQITVRDLAQECLERHGEDALDGMISRKLIEDACKKRNVAVSEQDIQEEIAREAATGIKPKQDGSVDIEGWIEYVTKKQGIPPEIYRSHVVWPTAAMRRLVRDNVQVTDEDLKKGYDAHFGPRVRCLAIFLDDQRRAQRVFELARKNNTSEYFGDLAVEYSSEAGTRALRGEFAPIKKNGGQPILEKEAFALKPGELSGVIALDKKFVILRCEGYTKPTNVSFASVRDDIYQDIFELKTRIATSRFYEDMRDAATIDNFLTGASHSSKAFDEKLLEGQRSGAPSGPTSGRPPAKSSHGDVPTLRQVPAG